MSKSDDAPMQAITPVVWPVDIKRLPHGNGLALPGLQTPLSAGYDLAAAVPDNAPYLLKPLARAKIPTGFALGLPQFMEAQIRTRSGLALAHGVVCANSPGTIDADYRGEIFIILINLGGEEFVITRGMRIAQLVFAPILKVKFTAVETLVLTARGHLGFGSTGI